MGRFLHAANAGACRSTSRTVHFSTEGENVADFREDAFRRQERPASECDLDEVSPSGERTRDRGGTRTGSRQPQATGIVSPSRIVGTQVQSGDRQQAQ